MQLMNRSLAQNSVFKVDLDICKVLRKLLVYLKVTRI